MKNCPNCGSKIQNDASACPYCGEVIKQTVNRYSEYDHYTYGRKNKSRTLAILALIFAIVFPAAGIILAIAALGSTTNKNDPVSYWMGMVAAILSFVVAITALVLVLIFI